MEPFEYVTILISLIIGLGIAQILINVADIISNLKRIKLSVEHLLMVFVVFVQHIQFWWYSWQYTHQVDQWDIKTVMFLLIYPIALQTLARMLFPTGWRGGETDLREYYYDQWNLLFGVFAVLPVTSFLNNVFVSGFAWHSQILQMVYFFWLVLFLAFKIRERWAHILFQSIQATVAFGWIIFDPYILEA